MWKSQKLGSGETDFSPYIPDEILLVRIGFPVRPLGDGIVKVVIVNHDFAVHALHFVLNSDVFIAHELCETEN